MPTTTNQTVTISKNSDGSFAAVIETDATQSVAISAAALISFIQSQDQQTPAAAPTTAAH